MRSYNVSPHTLARRGTSFTLHFRSICLPGSGVFQNLTEAHRKALKNLCLLTLNKKQRAKAGRMQESRLAGEGRTWQIFMANHCGVRWMAYKEHAELCTLWRSASVECSWAVWTSFFFFFSLSLYPSSGISIRVTTAWWQVQLELTVLMGRGVEWLLDDVLLRWPDLVVVSMEIRKMSVQCKETLRGVFHYTNLKEMQRPWFEIVGWPLEPGTWDTISCVNGGVLGAHRKYPSP